MDIKYILNSNNSVNWDNYKLFIDTLYHNKKSYYLKNINKSGNKYIYENYFKNEKLNPPYTNNELDILCKNAGGVKLPDILYNYLTRVSKQIFFYDNPGNDFLLYQKIPKKIDLDNSNIPKSKTSIYSYDDNEESINTTFLNGFLTIGNNIGSCFIDYIYIGSGYYYDSIWSCDDEGVFMYDNKSIYDVMISHFNRYNTKYNI